MSFSLPVSEQWAKMDSIKFLSETDMVNQLNGKIYWGIICGPTFVPLVVTKDNIFCDHSPHQIVDSQLSPNHFGLVQAVA